MTKLNQKRLAMLGKSSLDKESYTYRAVNELLENGGKVIRTGIVGNPGEDPINYTCIIGDTLSALWLSGYSIKNDSPLGKVEGAYIELRVRIPGLMREINEYNIGRRAW